MTATGTAPSNLSVDFIEFYVSDARASAADLVASYGFEVVGTAGTPDVDAGGHLSVAVRQRGITLLLTEALDDQHPAGLFVQRHGDGVANIGLGTPDARTAYAAAVAGGAQPVAPPAEYPDGAVTATIGIFGDVTHTFIQRPAAAELPGFVATTPEPAPGAAPAPALHEVDHFAVCLEAGTLDQTVALYEAALGFEVIFEERIVVGAQAMLSRVVQSPSRQVTFTLIEPDSSAEAGQIDDFLKDNAGPGVQHVAFRTENIVPAISALVGRGVAFLNTPAAYYRLLAERLDLARYGTDELRELNILVDEDHDGQLFQIFARSTHPRRTFFFEVIERLGARTFGSGNIKALYAAVEAERISTPGLP
ncbi:4-hydroxyphenylpyruvate dioxygenase [Phytohabitans rumicis]|uniref:4-hydroxyphenylpyruvate dioxygenase n=1 Tax=Phytohabitans rumicis TaxID=1076125 RepID=A0A6V8L2Z2_9ACTN|nr:4-hydroxyphenylpyruvate dioxygenase [Phytohabitans rumicis]GFJ91643.1 4-hydroxyphenylpyruvate dioxygenase [Phytohabitans rumicis]